MLRVIEYNFLVTQSLEVIRNGTIQKLGYGFLFAYSNYDCILYHFRDEARYWSKIAIFSYTPAFDAPLQSPSKYCHTVWCGKL